MIPRLESWCKYYAALNNVGHPVDALSDDACAWCASGWLIKMICCKELNAVHNALLSDEIIDLYVLNNPRPNDVMACYELLALWNDATTTTQEMVNAFFDAVNQHIQKQNETRSNTGQSSGLQHS